MQCVRHKCTQHIVCGRNRVSKKRTSFHIGIVNDENAAMGVASSFILELKAHAREEKEI